MCECVCLCECVTVPACVICTCAPSAISFNLVASYRSAPWKIQPARKKDQDRKIPGYHGMNKENRRYLLQKR